MKPAARLEARLLRQDGVQASNQLAIAESRTAVQAALPEDTAVLAYFVGDRRSHGWLLTQRELRHASCPGDAYSNELVHGGRSRSNAARSTRAAPDMPCRAFARCAAARRDRETPADPSRRPAQRTAVRHAAMPRGAPRELLVDRFVIAGAPSLAVALRESAPQHQSRDAGRGDLGSGVHA